jgi:hypothetical protein
MLEAVVELPQVYLKVKYKFLLFFFSLFQKPKITTIAIIGDG